MLGGKVYRLQEQDLDTLNTFNTRSVLTLGTEISKWILQVEIPRLACLVSK